MRVIFDVFFLGFFFCSRNNTCNDDVRSESQVKVKHLVGQVFEATLKMVVVPALGNGQ